MDTLLFIVPWILQTCIWIPTRFFLWFFGGLKVEGLENLRALPRGVIFAVNHTSELDPIVIPAALPFLCRLMPMFYTSREKEFYKNSGWRQIFYGGLFFKVWGAYPVVVGVHNYEKSLSCHLDLLRRGASLVIFPEGRRSRDGRLQEAKGGVAYLASRTAKPIVPVGIVGNFGLHPRDFFLRKARIRVIFGTPLSAAGILGTKPPAVVHGQDPYFEAAQRIMQSIAALMKTKTGKILAAPIPAAEKKSRAAV